MEAQLGGKSKNGNEKIQRRVKGKRREREGKEPAECVWSSDKPSSAAAHAVSHKVDGLFLGQALLNG